jgi:cell division protein FtsW
LLAIGSGGFFGVGLGNSYQKQLWLPEPQNDFIFAIVCEELGFVGGIAVIVLFMALMWRGFYIEKKAPDTFSSLLVTGLVAKVGIQALLNIAVVTTTIPTTGIALPFFSYGGTALIMQLMEMGIVLSVSRYTSQEKV